MTKYIATILITSAIVGASTFGIMQAQVMEIREENNTLKSLRGEEVTVTSQERQEFQLSIQTLTTSLESAQADIERLRTENETLQAQVDAFLKEEGAGDGQEQASAFDIFGGAEFDSIVTGYLEIVEGPVPFSEDEEETQENAYLVITDFAEEGLREEIEQGLERGNSINASQDGAVYFNLGCYVNEAIQGIEYSEDKEYIDAATLEALKTSTEQSPVDLILSFGIHGGRGCTCCHLAHAVRLAE